MEEETAVQIIRRLWMHIDDFRLLYSGYSSKSFYEIDEELKETERMCEAIYG